MTTKQSIRILLFLALTCFPLVATAQRRIEKGESTISGRVVYADTGRPVRRATVRLLTNLNYPPARVTPANVRGEFRFNQVAAGTYFVAAEASDGVSAFMIVLTEFGINADREPEHTRVSVDGKSATRCEVRVSRGSTIRGTVVYADKEPVTGAPIALFWRKNGAIRPLFTDRILTNDRGMYRIDGLPDGEYFVGVVDAKSRLSTKAFEARGVVTAYYPSVTGITDAKSIEVQSGSDVKGINITLGDDELRQVSGIVKWKNGGRPLKGAPVTLRRTEEPRVEASFKNVIKTTTPPDTNKDDTMFRDMGLLMLAQPPMVETNARGEWKFEDLPPGKYVLTAYASLPEKDKPVRDVEEEIIDDAPDSIGSSTRATVSGRVELTIGDEDLKDIVIELTEGGRISGVVVAEESLVPRLQISLVGRATEFLDELFSAATEGETFELEGVPSGDVQFDAEMRWEKDLYVKSITLGSQDLLRQPVRMVEGASLTGVRITIGKGLATLSGRVLFDEGGSLAGGSGVLVVRADPALWPLPSSRVFAATDPAGEFSLKCPPGEYLVFTWPAGRQPMQSISEFVRTNAASARRITLQSREEKRLDLTVAKPKK